MSSWQRDFDRFIAQALAGQMGGRQRSGRTHHDPPFDNIPFTKIIPLPTDIESTCREAKTSKAIVLRQQ